jgi:hypothetical protein
VKPSDYFETIIGDGWKCKLCNHKSKEKGTSTNGKWNYAFDKHLQHEELGLAAKQHMDNRNRTQDARKSATNEFSFIILNIGRTLCGNENNTASN